MYDFKIDNNKLLRAFLWYQLIEIAFIIFFLSLCSLLTVGRMDSLVIFGLSTILIKGVAIQIVIFIISWAICNLIGKRLWIIAKVVVCFCLDVIIPCSIFILAFLLAGMKGVSYDTSASKFFINTWFYLPIFILLSKVVFFKICKKRFDPKTVLKTSAAIHEEVNETVNSSSSAEDCYDEPEGFLCEENLKYYDEMNYSVYADDNQAILSVVFGDTDGAYCRYFMLSDTDIASGYDNLSNLANSIREKTQSFAACEISLDDLQKDVR